MPRSRRQVPIRILQYSSLLGTLSRTSRYAPDRALTEVAPRYLIGHRKIPATASPARFLLRCKSALLVDFVAEVGALKRPPMPLFYCRTLQAHHSMQRVQVHKIDAAFRIEEDQSQLNSTNELLRQHAFS